MVPCTEMGMRCRYARTASGRRNGSWQDIYLSGSGYNMQIADCEVGYRVAVVNFGGKYHWTGGEYGTEQLSRNNRWRICLVFPKETEFSFTQPFWNLDYSTSGASSADPQTNSGGHNARGGRVFEPCHQWDNMEPISISETCCTWQLQISTRSIWTHQ